MKKPNIVNKLVAKYSSAGWKMSSKSLFCSFTRIRIRDFSTPLSDVIGEELGIITNSFLLPHTKISWLSIQNMSK
jgi:hypothetical protein